MLCNYHVDVTMSLYGNYTLGGLLSIFLEKPTNRIAFALGQLMADTLAP